jgi:hypothetical protein
MENQIINAVSLSNTTLAQARLIYLESTASANAGNQVYADAMLATFGGQWWTIADKATKKSIKAERGLFVEGLESLGFKQGTIDVYWQRVKVACGYIPAGNKASGSETIDAKTLKELKTIINRILGDDSDGEGSVLAQKAKADLMSAFIKMGGNIETDLGK